MIKRIRHSQFSQFVIAVIALPLAAMPLSARPDMMKIDLCSADGEVRSLSIPVEQERGDDPCAKPCHACMARKKSPKS